MHLFAGLRARLLPPVTLRAIRVAEHGQGQLVREQAARAEAEAAQRRLAFLAEASQVLASSLDYEETLARVARLAVPTLADYCTVNLCEADGSLRRVGKAHADPRKETAADEMHRRYPRGSSEGPVARVARTGVSELIPDVSDELLRAISQDADHLRRWRKLAPPSVLVVPLAARNEILGTLSLIITESERRYTQADLPLAEDLAQRAALAIDNARLHAEA